MEGYVFSVSELTGVIKDMFDGIPVFTDVRVTGEISNYKLHASGHHYMSIKDASASIRCVLFKFDARALKDPLQNGDDVVVRGRISVYPRDGQYQLYAASIEKSGMGDLHRAFEQLKAKLAEQGLFSDRHKKPLPPQPRYIAVITSKTGAVFSDICKILKARYPMATVLFAPSAVQGAAAPAELAAALRLVNCHNKADVIIIGRGGGSLEDLWAFNTEEVAQAIFCSKIPVISAVGHEPDVTIADLVADRRASTPSNGAELAVPDKTAFFAALSAWDARLTRLSTAFVAAKRERLARLLQSRVLSDPSAALHPARQRQDYAAAQCVAAMERLVARHKARWESLNGRLLALSPTAVLRRGYAIVCAESGVPVTKVRQLADGVGVTITMQDGTRRARIEKAPQNKKDR